PLLSLSCRSAGEIHSIGSGVTPDLTPVVGGVGNKAGFEESGRGTVNREVVFAMPYGCLFELGKVGRGRGRWWVVAGVGEVVLCLFDAGEGGRVFVGGSGSGSGGVEQEVGKRYTHGLTTLQINSILAPPTIKPRTAPKKLARKRCRIKRSSKTDNNGGPYDGEGFFDGGDGPFGGGGGGGGRGGGDGFNWDESVPVEPTDPAFDFVYEVLCWIVLSNCLHFAFKKVFRIVSDSEREKVVSARYLKGQPKLGLWYPKVSSFDLEAYSDSDYAAANFDWKSTTGEYVAVAHCCGQVLWIQNQLLDYGFNIMNTKIYINNESTICIVKNPVFHSKTKHIEIRHHFIRDAYEKKLIQVLKIHTDDNVADLLTKAFDVSSKELASPKQMALAMKHWLFQSKRLLIVDFLNAQVIQYALMVNPTIYVLCIKEFWATVLIKKVNNVVKFAKRTAWNEFSCSMAFVVICLATGRKFNFFKYIFDSMVRNVDNPSKFLMYPLFLQVIINAQVDDLSSLTNQYTSLVLTQKVFANMRRVGKGFSGVETPLFSTMLVQPQPPAAEKEDEEQKPDTSESSMSIINTLMETCATLSQKVAHLEQDKIAQALEIFKFKKRVKKLEKKRRSKSLGLQRLRKVGRKDDDNAAIKEASATEPTIFDDEENKMQPGKSKKDDLEKAKVLQKQYVDKKENIDWNVVVEQMQEKHLDNIKKYQSLKRKLISIAQARKNMIVYLKNMAGYKMEHFKGMTYDKLEQGCNIDNVPAIRQLALKDEHGFVIHLGSWLH
nr:putative ribonuclease H-like domain-containing protein [Tanacetum cinerariifolium]